MSSATFAGTDVDKQTSGSPQAALVRQASTWLFGQPAIVVLLFYLAVGIPGLSPGYFESERAERAALRADAKSSLEAQARAYDTRSELLGKQLERLAEAFDHLADELRRSR